MKITFDISTDDMHRLQNGETIQVKDHNDIMIYEIKIKQ